MSKMRYIASFLLLCLCYGMVDYCGSVRGKLFNQNELENSIVARREWNRLLPLYSETIKDDEIQKYGRWVYNLLGPIGPVCKDGLTLLGKD